MEMIDRLAIERQKAELDKEILRNEINRDVNFEQGWFELALEYDMEVRRLRQIEIEIFNLMCKNNVINKISP